MHRIRASGRHRRGGLRARHRTPGRLPAALPRLLRRATAEAEVTKAGSNDVLRSFTVPAAPVMGWVDAGALHLDPGAYDATVLLPEGGVLEYVELAPPCLHPIEPRGGWKASAIATTEDVAVTVLQALDLESELPPAATPIELHGSDLRLEDGSPAGDAAGRESTFRSGAKGSRVVLVVDIPESGLYTLSIFGVPGGGQRWMADGCRQCSRVPLERPAAALARRPLRRLPEGLAPLLREPRARHRRRAHPPRAEEGRARRLRRHRRPSRPRARPRRPDQLATRTEEARRFLERRRAQEAMELCGDILRPGTLVAELATTTGSSGSGSGEGGGEGGGWDRRRRGRRRRGGRRGPGAAARDPAAAAAEPGAARSFRGRKLAASPQSR